MKIIICGAGRVGMSIAGYLCQQNNHVTVIDNNIELIKHIVNTHDIHGLQGHAAQPSVLKKAGAETADVIIAVTDCDEVNMVACQVAHSIFGVSRKIARVRERDYRDPSWSDLYSRNNLPIDVIISPEEEIAKAILYRMSVPGTTYDLNVHDSKLNIFGLIASDSNGLVDQSVKNVYYRFRNANMSIVLVIRDNETIIPNDEFVIHASDEVYFAIEHDFLFECLENMGVKSAKSGHIVICGGGEIGLSLAERIEEIEGFKNKNLTVIENNLDRARFINRKLDKSLVINGSALDHSVLEEADVDRASIFVSVMNNNENNILSAMMAKKMGALYSLALSTNKLYNHLLPDRSVDAIINPEVITVSGVLRYLRRGRIISVNTLRNSNAELVEAEITSNCSVANIPIGEIYLPKDIRIISIYDPITRIVSFPTKDTVIKEGNVITVLSLSKDITKVEKLFSFSIDLF